MGGRGRPRVHVPPYAINPTIEYKPCISGIKGAYLTNAKELYAKAQALSKAKKMPLHKWSFFKADGGTDVLLMADRYGNPRITILPAKAEGQAKSKVTKLA